MSLGPVFSHKCSWLGGTGLLGEGNALPRTCGWEKEQMQVLLVQGLSSYILLLFSCLAPSPISGQKKRQMPKLKCCCSSRNQNCRAQLPSQASSLVLQEEGFGGVTPSGDPSCVCLRHNPVPQKRRSCSAPPARPAPAPRGRLALQTLFSAPRAGNLILHKHLHRS